MSAIHYLGFIKKRADLGFDRFDEHWRTVHSDLVLEGGLPDRIERYVQNVGVPCEESGIASDFDGAPEIWIRDQAALEALFAAPAFQIAYHADSPKFVTLPAVSFFIEDRLVCGPQEALDGLRLIRLIALPDSPDDIGYLRRRWEDEPTPLGLGNCRADRLIRSRIISAEAAGTDASAFLGIESSWWSDVAALRRAWESRSQGGWNEQVLLARERIQHPAAARPAPHASERHHAIDGLTESGAQS